jgi:FtsP/CotA-like multicopper oxidase with cupredoxin domain
MEGLPTIRSQNYIAASTSTRLRGASSIFPRRYTQDTFESLAKRRVRVVANRLRYLEQPLQNPGPLIRVPQGTEISASLHNTLAPITVHGLGDLNDSSDAVLHVAPGVTEQVRFKAKTPGLYLYWGAAEVEDLTLRYGIDSELTGALVVDPADTSPGDEIFVLEMMSEHPGANARQTLATITGESRPLVVTQRVAQGETFDMSWSPDRPGRWLFHCHMFQHMIPPVVPNVPGLSMRPAVAHPSGHAAMHDALGHGTARNGRIGSRV